jgi:hypothetical protein
MILLKGPARFAAESDLFVFSARVTSITQQGHLFTIK